MERSNIKSRRKLEDFIFPDDIRGEEKQGKSRERSEERRKEFGGDAAMEEIFKEDEQEIIFDDYKDESKIKEITSDNGNKREDLNEDMKNAIEEVVKKLMEDKEKEGENNINNINNLSNLEDIQHKEEGLKQEEIKVEEIKEEERLKEEKIKEEELLEEKIKEEIENIKEKGKVNELEELLEEVIEEVEDIVTDKKLIIEEESSTDKGSSTKEQITENKEMGKEARMEKEIEESKKREHEDETMKGVIKFVVLGAVIILGVYVVCMWITKSQGQAGYNKEKEAQELQIYHQLKEYYATPEPSRIEESLLQP